MFDSILFAGQNFADAMKKLLSDIARDLLDIAVRLGVRAAIGALTGGAGVAVDAAGLGILSGVSSLAPARGRGDTYVIQTLDAGTLRSAIQPGGTFNRAQDRVLIGARY